MRVISPSFLILLKMLHLIAQKLAEALDWYDLIEEEDGLYDSLMGEWKRVTP